MIRRLTVLGMAIAGLCLLLAGEGVAQDATAPVEAATATDWPVVPVDPDYFRGPGFYLSLVKIATCWLLFLAWVKTTDWINQDLQVHRLRINLWNPIVVGTFAFAFLLIWILPYFWLGLVLMIAAWAGPLATYIFYYRNPKLEAHEHVLTPEHLRFWVAAHLKRIGIHIDAEAPNAHDIGPPLQLVARSGATDQDNEAYTVTARQMPGFVPARMLLADALGARASAVMLDIGNEVAVRYRIDGVWHNHQPQPLEATNHVVAVWKVICGIDPNVPVAKVAGRFAVSEGASDIPCDLSYQASKTAQRVLVTMHQPPSAFEELEDIGMRASFIEALRESFQQEKGILLFSALPAGGLTTTLDVALSKQDRFLRDFVSVEDADAPESVVSNVDPKTYKRSEGESPATILRAVGRASPDVIVCRNLVDSESGEMLFEQSEERLIIGSIVAKDAPEALLRVLAMKIPASAFAPHVHTALHVRLIRKLCESCREPYAPSAELLKKLGIPAGKVESLYRPPTDSEAPTCESCGGIGYLGRTGLFELLRVDDTIRKVLTTKPQYDLLRKAARKAGMQSELEHGIVLVAKGVTSVQELQRALKG